MPRSPRIQVARGAYHVTARGNRQQPVFASSGDHILFLDLFGRVVERIEGDYLNVVGLPAALLVRLLAARFAGVYGFG